MKELARRSRLFEGKKQMWDWDLLPLSSQQFRCFSVSVLSRSHIGGLLALAEKKKSFLAVGDKFSGSEIRGREVSAIILIDRKEKNLFSFLFVSIWKTSKRPG